MKQLLYYVLALSVLLVSWTCRSKIVGENGFIPDGSEAVTEKKRSTIDQYILDSFIRPFNVEVKYKFDALDNGSTNIGATLVPPREEIIVPLLRAIHKVWIAPYLQVKDSGFLRTYIPKQIVLVGSKNYKSDGTVVLGVAEGGKRILLFDVNNYSVKKNKGGFRQMVHTIQHEFAHILHQTVLFDPAYRSISLPADYTSRWYDVRSPENYRKGFVTPYSMYNPEEDFVEVLSTVLVDSKKGLDSIVKAALEEKNGAKPPAPGRVLIERKYTMVQEYLSNIWQINMDDLEKKVQAALKIIEEDKGNTYEPVVATPQS